MSNSNSGSGHEQSPRPDPPQRGDRADSWLKILAAVLAVITALVGLAAGYFGYQASQSNKEAAEANQAASSARSAASTLATAVSTLSSGQSVASSDLAEASSSISELNSALSSAESENTQLSSQLADLAATTGAQTAFASNTVAPTGTAYHSGPLTLAWGGDGADLDAPPDDKNWTGDGQWDFSYNADEGSVLFVGNKAKSKLLDKGITANLGTCSTGGGYQTNYVRIDLTEKTRGICVLTGDNRYVALNLARPLDGRNAVFDVVSFN